MPNVNSVSNMLPIVKRGIAFGGAVGLRVRLHWGAIGYGYERIAKVRGSDTSGRV